MVVRTRSMVRLAQEDSSMDLSGLRPQRFEALRHDSAASLASEVSTSKLDCSFVQLRGGEKDSDDSRSSTPRSGKHEASSKPRLRFSFQAPCLCHFHSLPPQLQFNHYVHQGYRVQYSTWDCFRSLFQWHNETVNIHTHLAALILVVVLMLTSSFRITSPDALAAFVGLSMLPLLLAYVLSIAYHGFMAHWRMSGHDAQSHANYDRLLCADVAGVVAALAAPWVCTTYFAFARDTKLLVIFGSILAGATAAGVSATQSPDQTKRIIPLGLLLMSHWVTIAARLRGYGLQCPNSMGYYLTSEVLVVAGGTINALFLPERFFPGKVDFILNSHQIMHICTLVATWTVFRAMSEDYVCYRSTA